VTGSGLTDWGNWTDTPPPLFLACVDSGDLKVLCFYTLLEVLILRGLGFGPWDLLVRSSNTDSLRGYLLALDRLNRRQDALRGSG